MKLYRDSIDIFNDDYLQSTFYIDMYGAYQLFEHVLYDDNDKIGNQNNLIIYFYGDDR